VVVTGLRFATHARGQKLGMVSAAFAEALARLPRLQPDARHAPPVLPARVAGG